jgi:DNA-binding FadR family transcriptional regulator
MERDGIIFRRQGQGTFVLPPPLPHAPRVRSLAASVSPSHVMEVRLQIEPALAALAAERATPEAIRQLQALCATTATFHSLDSFDRADDIFHYKIAQMADNPLFMSIFEEIRAVRRDAAWIARVQDSYPAHKVAETAAQHVAICTAIAGQVPQEAADAMLRHLTQVSQSRRQTVGPDPVP